MIQDIEPEVMHNEFLGGAEAAPEPGSIVFIFRGQEMYCRKKENGSLEFPTVQLIADGCRHEAEKSGESDENTAVSGCLASRLTYLFRIDQQKFFLMKAEDGIDFSAEDFGWKSFRLLRSVNPKDLCFAGMTAWHLHGWYRDNCFCGRCGKPLLHKASERALVCPECGNTVYPKIAPAVIVGVMNRSHDKMLVTRYANRPYRGDALIAGFCEIGETAEGTVRREVMEEAGIHVDHIRYYKSQPWGFDSNLLIGFYAEADDSEPIQMDESELAQAVWVDKNELDRDVNLSLTADMMMHFRN
ncbi:MAG: NAD(+) diphosphatase, partial [Eubacterium sp.]